jgi:anti-sigma regulatory factor (Ser/Thr protein kinase)
MTHFSRPTDPGPPPGFSRSSGLTHRAFVYDEDTDFLRAAVPFMQEGIDAGDAVLAISSTRGVSELRHALGSGSDAVEFGDSASWYAQPTRTIAAYSSFVAENATARIRVVAEPGWETGSAAEISEWTRYEAIVNQAFMDVDASVLCLYDRRTTDPGFLDGALLTHPELSDGTRTRPNGAYLDTPAIHARVDRDPLPAPPPEAVPIPIDTGSGTWPPTGTDLTSMRSRLSEHARRRGMSRPRLNDLLVAATEVATNAIRHGVPPVECRMWAENGDVVVDVTDTGSWEPDDVPGFIPPDPAARSGFGLWGVRMLCGLVQIRTCQPGTAIRLYVPCR